MKIKRSNRRMALFFFLAANAVVLPAYAMEKTPDEWITEANQSLKSDPKDAKAYYNRGTGRYGKGDYEDAIKDFSSAVLIEPNAPDVYFNRGLSYRRLNKIDEAILDFSKAIELYPAQPAYYAERCNAHIVRNDLNGAITDCSEAIKLLPEADSGYFLRGVAYLLKGDLDKALADSVQTLQIWPDHPHARRLLYETLIKRGAMINKYDPLIQSDMRGTRAVNRSRNLSGGVLNTEKT